jgi:hypothetical protein
MKVEKSPLKHSSFSTLALIAVVLVSSSKSARANDIYIAPSSVGSGAGTSCGNAQTFSYFNASGNWNSNPTGVQIGPGSTVHVCSGTYTGALNATALRFQLAGTSGRPVTLVCDQGTATFTSPAWSSTTGAITSSAGGYLVLNGGGNCTISNLANGTGLANSQTSYGIYLSSCTNCVVENWVIKNIYINQGSNSSATDTNGENTVDIEFAGASTNSIASGNTVSQAKTGIQFAPDPNGDASNIQISGNSVSDTDWGINVGGGDSGDTINNIVIKGNTITNWTNWQFPTNVYHQDGVILFNAGNPAAGLTATIYNNYVYGNLGIGSPTGFLYCADFTSCTVYNNLLVNTGNTIDGIIWLGQGTNLGRNFSVYNNTIVSNQNDIAITLAINGHATFQNNLVFGVNAGIHDYNNLTADVALSNNNVWRTGSGTAPDMATNDSSYITYATWQGYGYDASSSTGNPNLSGTYGLQAGSSAIGLGANLASFGLASLDQDMALNPRPGTPGSLVPVGSWDVGVYNSTIAPAAPTGLAISSQ